MLNNSQFSCSSNKEGRFSQPLNIFFIQHVPSYWVLMCGRVAGGMATSILFSAFESWVICEHDKVHEINLLSFQGSSQLRLGHY